MQSESTFESVLPIIEKATIELEASARQVAAHRRKSQYAVSQFRNFVNLLKQEAMTGPLSVDQATSFENIMRQIQKYRELFSQYSTQNWANPALQNSCASAGTELFEIGSSIQGSARVLNPDFVSVFDLESPQWLHYQMLDIQAISATFKLTLSQPNQPPDVVKLLKARVKSIDHFQDTFNDQDLTPGTRIFSPIPIHFQSWRLNHTDFRVDEETASGVSAIVYRGVDLRTGEVVAIKQLKIKKLKGSRLVAFQREVAILATANYPAILKFIGATDTPPYWIVTEWMAGATLYHDLHEHRVNPTQKTIAAYDIARGMTFLHSRSIIHRDLKSLNVLLDENQRIRICDFGFSRKAKKDEFMTASVGTSHWMAPELIMATNNYDQSVDIYSYGIILWELLTEKTPYQNMNNFDIAKYVTSGSRPPIPPDCPNFLLKLIKECWNSAPERRPSALDIVEVFGEGDTYFEGSDIDEINRYFAENPYIDPDVAAIDPNIGFEDLIDLVCETDSQAVVNFLWGKLAKFEHFELERGYVYFLRTCRGLDASILLRNAENARLDVVQRAATYYPTGDPNTDENLAVFMCKNKGAVNLLEIAFKEKHVILALEIIALQGIKDESKIDDVVSICLKKLDSSNSDVLLSAIRCLISLDRIAPLDIMTRHIQSTDIRVREASYVMAELILLQVQGVKFPSNLIDSLTSHWKLNQLAAQVIAVGCRMNKGFCSDVLSKMDTGDFPADDFLVDIIDAIISQKDRSLKEKMIRVKGKLDIYLDSNPYLANHSKMPSLRYYLAFSE